jgi:hypothetical protein
MSFSMRREKVP